MHMMMITLRQEYFLYQIKSAGGDRFGARVPSYPYAYTTHTHFALSYSNSRQ